MTTLSPYLFFNGNCREAMEYYKSIFGGKLDVMTVGQSPMAEQMPDMKDSIIHAALSADVIMIMASDMIDKGTATHGNSVVLCLVCKSKEEVENFYNKLSEGGEVKMPLKDEFFGTFGSVTDKYGFQWMMQYSADSK